MTNKDIAKRFLLMSNLLEIHEGNEFQVRSFQSTYRVLRNIEGPIVEKTDEELSQIPRVGKSTIDRINEIKSSGTFPDLEELIQRTPEGIVDMLSVKGLGAKKIKTIWEDLKITNPGELLYACRENRLVDLKGFGAKTQANIETQLAYFIESKGKVLYGRFEDEALTLLENIRNIPDVSRAEFTGIFRRKMPVIDKLEFLVIGDEALVESKVSQIEHVVQESEGLRYHGVPLILHFTDEHQFALDWLIGSSAENFCLEYGIEDQCLESEEAIFEDVGAAYVVPEMRDGFFTIDELDEFDHSALISREDLQGCVHNHSTYSDGTHTLKQMADATKEMGYSYFVISDHSQAAFYANGLSEEQLILQSKEIQSLNEQYDGFKIFHGIEADILADGSLDYTPEILSSLDVVIASIHAHLNMDIDKATHRLITAIENPLTDILGHPTGRLLLSRKGYPIDYEKVIDACAANGVCIELNANPYRLDLDWEWIIYALQRDVFISINPDAHSIEGLNDVNYGIHAARKAGLTAHECLNAMSVDAFEKWLNDRK